MAIIQISRIQMRRGLSDNVPQLASAELGWAIDTRKLYIGNGTLSEGAPTTGNTEILTAYSDIVSLQNTYVFRGEYDGLAAVQTGPNLLSPVSRSMQSKLDDIVNARDFGAHGDGSTNNVDILNRAIIEIYRAGISITSTEASKRRTIHLPAGVYNLTGDVIHLLPYVKLKGDGKNSTFIVQTDPTQTCVAMSVDSADQTGIAIGSGGATKPVGLQLEDMTLINQNNGDVLILDSTDSTLLRRVACAGNKMAPTSTITGNDACVRIITNAPGAVSRRIYMESCDFTGQTYAIQADSAIDGITVYDGNFADLAVGVSVGENSAGTLPSNVKVSFSVFDRIAQSAVVGHNEVEGLVSAFNHYKDVGNDLGANPGAFPVVKLDHSSNYSIADQFDRTPTEALVTPTVDTGDRAIISTLPGGILSHGKYRVASATDIILLDDQAALAPTGAFTPLANAVTVAYSLTRGSNTRNGTMKIVQDGTNIVYDDEYVQTGDTGVTLEPIIVGSTVELNYKSDPLTIPENSTFKAAIKYLT